MINDNQEKFLFSITSTDMIIKEPHNIDILDDFYCKLPNIYKINMTAYRECRSVIELVIYYNDNKTFLLTIWEDGLNISPISQEDIRLAHKEISLPDSTDIMVFITRIAHHAQLSVALSSSSDSSEVFVFNS